MVIAAMKHLLVYGLCECRECICSQRRPEKVGKEEAAPGSGIRKAT